jgi:hypothetical protein
MWVVDDDYIMYSIVIITSRTCLTGRFIQQLAFCRLGFRSVLLATEASYTSSLLIRETIMKNPSWATI